MADAAAEVQVFVYQFNEDDNTYQQVKLEDPATYVIRDNPNVPPGDCIIFEFSPAKPFTDKLCGQYGVRDIERCEEFGVGPDERSICENTDVTDYEGLQAAFDAENPADTSTAPADDTASEGPGAIASDAQCSPFFDNQGQPTGVEIAVLKDDGTTLNPDTDCTDYALEVRCDYEATTPEGQSADCVALTEEAETGGDL